MDLYYNDYSNCMKFFVVHIVSSFFELVLLQLVQLINKIRSLRSRFNLLIYKEIQELLNLSLDE